MRLLLAATLTTACCTPALAQSLYHRTDLVQHGRTAQGDGISLAAPANAPKPLNEVSLFAVEPPRPVTFAKHDIIQVIINETSVQKFQQSLETQKSYGIDGEITTMPDLLALLELRLQQGDRSPLARVGASGTKDFDGDGTFERRDQMTTRVSATVLEVKPNGTLVIEAKKTYKSDGESVTLVVSGLARPDDVTRTNTVQSSQIANLIILIENEGDVRDTAKKGLISQVLDTIFAF